MWFNNWYQPIRFTKNHLDSFNCAVFWCVFIVQCFVKVMVKMSKYTLATILKSNTSEWNESIDCHSDIVWCTIHDPDIHWPVSIQNVFFEIRNIFFIDSITWSTTYQILLFVWGCRIACHEMQHLIALGGWNNH